MSHGWLHLTPVKHISAGRLLSSLDLRTFLQATFLLRVAEPLPDRAARHAV